MQSTNKFLTKTKGDKSMTITLGKIINKPFRLLDMFKNDEDKPWEFCDFCFNRFDWKEKYTGIGFNREKFKENIKRIVFYKERGSVSICDNCRALYNIKDSFLKQALKNYVKRHVKTQGCKNIEK